MVGEIDLVRALGLAGIRAAVLARPDDSVRFSRYTATALDYVDASQEPERLVEVLLAFAQGQPEKPVLYYNADWHLLAISAHREALRGAFRFVIPDASLVDDLVDKAKFQALAGRLGLPVPKAIRLSPGADPPTAVLRFPVVVKQLTRHYGSWEPITSAKAMHVANQRELERVWPRLGQGGFDVLVQEWIPGPESQVESYHAYVDESGEFVGEFTGKKVRTLPPELGYSTALVTTDAPDVAQAGGEILRRLGLRGVAKIDFKRDPRTRALHLLEINPRFNLWHHVGAKAGVNLPALVYADLTGLPRPPRTSARAGVRWCSVWLDAKAARAEGVSLARWLPWMLKADAKSGIAWDDPLPVLRRMGAMAVAGARTRARGRRNAPAGGDGGANGERSTAT